MLIFDNQINFGMILPVLPLRVVSSEVERFLDTEEVRSSILLSPTIDKEYDDSGVINASEFLVCPSPIFWRKKNSPAAAEPFTKAKIIPSLQ